jgi:hypothetical protein
MQKAQGHHAQASGSCCDERAAWPGHGQGNQLLMHNTHHWPLAPWKAPLVEMACHVLGPVGKDRTAGQKHRLVMQVQHRHPRHPSTARQSTPGGKAGVQTHIKQHACFAEV